MSTASNMTHYPDDMVRASQMGNVRTDDWVEQTVCSVVESLEEVARAKPLLFAAGALGIGFILGWKLKPW